MSAFNSFTGFHISHRAGSVHTRRLSFQFLHRIPPAVARYTETAFVTFNSFTGFHAPNSNGWVHWLEFYLSIPSPDSTRSARRPRNYRHVVESFNSFTGFHGPVTVDPDFTTTGFQFLHRIPREGEAEARALCSEFLSIPSPDSTYAKRVIRRFLSYYVFQFLHRIPLTGLAGPHGLSPSAFNSFTGFHLRVNRFAGSTKAPFNSFTGFH